MKNNSYSKRVSSLVLIFVVLSCTNMYSQITFQEHTITTSAMGAESVYAVDIDNDGDIDVLSASIDDDKIAWYENTDGLGTFIAQQIITTSAVKAASVHAADIDGDGDMDVLSASVNDDKIAWYKNTNGQGEFGAQQVIINNADGAVSVFAIDIDNDGDVDVLSASAFDDKIAWYKNDGNGNFGGQLIIADSVDGASSVYAIDIDGDGNIDVLSSSRYNNRISWYKNNGSGTFGAKQIITSNAEMATSVYSVDVDGDGDSDVLSSSWEDNKIAWYENLDGKGNFGGQQIVTSEAYHASSVSANDIDGDGDIDILYTTERLSGYNIVWYENTNGLGNFAIQHIIQTNNSSFSAISVDIDNDGDIDIIASHRAQNRLAWYENTSLNDICSNAFDLTKELAGRRSYIQYQDATLATNNAGFIETCGTNSTGENGNMNDGVWYYFNALYSGEITIYVIPDGSWDAELGVYTGSCADLTCLNSADNATNGGLETLTFPVNSGVNYYINVGSWMPANDGAEGPFYISISYNCDGTAPPNDSIADAVQVTVDSFTDNNVNLPCAKSEGSIFNTCNEWYAATYDVFYKFKATNASTVTATITNPTNFPAVVFYEAPDLNAKQKDLTHVNQASNPCGFGSTSSITTQAGRNYYLFASNGSITDIYISGVSYSGTKNISIAGFKMYPNPAESTLYLQADNIINSISIYNIIGQKTAQSMPNRTKAQLDLSSMISGIYMVKVFIDNQTSSYILIKE